MNISANMLGLDNAATPMGLRAMQEMQTLNPNKDTATDAMIMFLVLNSSGLCLVPVSIMMYRAQGGAANPTDVFVPILDRHGHSHACGPRGALPQTAYPNGLRYMELAGWYRCFCRPRHMVLFIVACR